MTRYRLALGVNYIEIESRRDEEIIKIIARDSVNGQKYLGRPTVAFCTSEHLCDSFSAHSSLRAFCYSKCINPVLRLCVQAQ